LWRSHSHTVSAALESTTGGVAANIALHQVAHITHNNAVNHYIL
jgi:hypothetical protein